MLRSIPPTLARHLKCTHKTYSTASKSTPLSPTLLSFLLIPTATATATPLSSCAAQTVLPGLNYLKGQPPTIAQTDEAYPAWLWTVLSPKAHEDDGPGGKKERVERRRANRQGIKDRNFMQTQ